jgi:hypothetical protein
MIPLQTFMDLGRGYYPARQGQGVDQDPSWPVISQNQSFLGPWSQMPQPIVIASPTVASHAGGTTVVSMSHTDITSSTPISHVRESSPTFVHHVGDEPPTSVDHAERMSLAIVSDAKGIPMIEKPRHIGCKPKFLCRLYKGGHLTRSCPTTVVVEELQSLFDNPSGSESSLVS